MTNNDQSSLVDWHDYEPNQDTGSEHDQHVSHVRIGFREYLRLLKGGKNNKNTSSVPSLEIPEYAFWWNNNLKQVQIYLPMVSRIGNYAFGNCCHLEQVEFLMKPPREEEEEEEEGQNEQTLEDNNISPSQLVSIGDWAFYACYELESVIGLEYAQDSIQVIGNSIFYHCPSQMDSLSSLTSLKYIGCSAFSKNKTMTSVDLSGALSLTWIEACTFDGCSSLVLLHLPPGLRGIGERAFSGCSGLEEIIIPSNLQRIGKKAFEKCKKLKSIAFPSSVEKIGIECFHECDKLRHVVLPSSHTPFLKTHPFVSIHCKSLAYLELPNPVPSKQFPAVLEQLCRMNGIASQQGRIPNPKNRNTLVWNFLCQHMAQLFVVEENRAVSR